MGFIMENDQSENSKIIERIYDVAIDPSRLEELVDIWEERIAPMRIKGDELQDYNDTTFDHFSRMGLFLDRLQFTESHEIIQKIDNTGTLAALIVSSDLKIKQLNTAAENLFNLKKNDLINAITPDLLSQETLQLAIKKAIDKPPGEPDFLRFRLEDSERFILVQIRAIKPQNQATETYGIKTPLGLKSIEIIPPTSNQRLALIITTELAWRPSFSNAIKNAFDLTSAEVEIIRGLTEGYTIESIAKARGRSKATIRTQIRSIFQKTETRSQAELIRISLSLMDMTDFTEKQASEPKNNIFEAPTLSPTIFHTIPRPNNRRLDHIIIGDPDGKPILFFAGNYGLIRLPASAEAEIKARGIKIIVPIRGGYGKSDELPLNINYLQQVNDDYLALLDFYNIDSCAIISQHTDFWIATVLAASHPSRITAIIACAPMMPLWKKEQYERMDKWYKFIIANARYAPKILPYLVKAGFYLALSIGQHGFMNAIFSESQADKDTYAIPETFEAMITGADIVLSKQFTAHKVFSRESILHAKNNWVDELESLKDKIPVHAFMGEDSPMVPSESLKEYKQRYNWIDFHIMPNAGELILFKHWREIISFSENYLK